MLDLIHERLNCGTPCILTKHSSFIPGGHYLATVLGGSYLGVFTEGFDTRDLKEAKALLEELAA
jgi:hypothetical protein